MLPFSQNIHETEADKVVLVLMAICRNQIKPYCLVKRMSANSGGQAPPEFMSTRIIPTQHVANLKK
jgi:hypothetical protein